MATSQGGNYPAPSAPPAPAGYATQQSWHPSTYNSAPPSYSGAQPTLACCQTMRAQPTYMSQNSFQPTYTTQNSFSPTASQYPDSQKMTNQYVQAPHNYGQPAPPPGYNAPQPPPNNYGQAPATYGQPTYGPSSHVQQPALYPPQYGPPYRQTSFCANKVQFPPGTDPQAIRAWEMGDADGNGFIDEQELGRVLTTDIAFQLRTVHLMLHLYSSSASNKIGPTEFIALWKALKEWKGVFERFDRDRSGKIDFQELRDALLSMGYSISPTLLQILLSKYDKTGQAKALDYDNFVECGLVVKGLTDGFKAKDEGFKGSATLDYETFMKMVLPFIVA